MIKTEHEAPGIPNHWPLESCCFCSRATPMWYIPKDVPVCDSCAKLYDDEDVPTKEHWLSGAPVAVKLSGNFWKEAYMRSQVNAMGKTIDCSHVANILEEIRDQPNDNEIMKIVEEAIRILRRP